MITVITTVHVLTWLLLLTGAAAPYSYPFGGRLELSMLCSGAAAFGVTGNELHPLNVKTKHSDVPSLSFRCSKHNLQIKVLVGHFAKKKIKGRKNLN